MIRLFVIILFFPLSVFANDELHFAVQQSIEDRLGADIEVQILGIKTRGPIPSDFVLELRSDPVTQSQLKLLVRNAKGSGTAWVDAEVELFASAMVLAEGAERGDPVQVRWERKALRELPRDRARMDDLEDAVATRSLRSGAVLTSRDIERARIVERARPVTVRVTRGQVIVTQRGIAMQHGRRGDLIRVRTTKNQTIQAVVVDGNTCEVP